MAPRTVSFHVHRSTPRRCASANSPPRCRLPPPHRHERGRCTFLPGLPPQTRGNHCALLTDTGSWNARTHMTVIRAEACEWEKRRNGKRTGAVRVPPGPVKAPTSGSFWSSTVCGHVSPRGHSRVCGGPDADACGPHDIGPANHSLCIDGGGEGQGVSCDRPD
jgi:hypothetical protein